ncbi:allergen [Colletotrichum truncatum]|uniref:Allergen n=1 Tax=Colletotrichum truncatum TaxID=5467 RepID=A0ACC3YWK0_COLTU|nr:allergen [Colletotrichum truncatum]KAF6787493.1 allergen [Colletotrichum truncatum]
MEKAKQAVSSFISGAGHHKTTVTQDANQAITDEQVRPHQHENVTTAIDKEVHQDHHHTTIQPIKAKETLPEKHHHNIVPTQHKTFEHGNESETRNMLDREAAKFKNTSTIHETSHSTTTAPAVTGERVHHHVHEHIQPVIQKETIQPHVVHTTVPIHEVHHAKPIHHGSTVLPTKTLEEFNKDKHKLTGENHKLTEYDGCPDKFNKEYQASEHMGLGSHSEHHGSGKAAVAAAGAAAATNKHHNTTTGATLGANNGAVKNHGIGSHGLENQRASDSVTAAQTANTRANTGTARENIAHGHTTGKTHGTGTSTAEGILHGKHTTGENNYTTSGNTGTGSGLNRGASLNKAEPRFGSSAGTSGSRTSTDHTGAIDASGKKVSLVDKLNPFKDADGDGHKGIMS